MGVHKTYNPYSNKWVIEFLGKRWYFTEEKKADEWKTYLVRKYIVGGEL